MEVSGAWEQGWISLTALKSWGKNEERVFTFCLSPSKFQYERSSLFVTPFSPLQIYYSFCGLENPMHYKSGEQQQLLEHMRHPIFLAPLIILWAIPVMTYDRLLVAVMLPLYLGWGSSINHLDASYIKQQFRMKRIQLLADGDLKSDWLSSIHQGSTFINAQH